MKLLSTALLSVYAIVTVQFAHAQEGADGHPMNEPATSEAPAENNKEFNQDLDDFEKNINKEVPTKKTKAGIPGMEAPAAAPDKAAVKAKETMKAASKKNAPKTGKKKPVKPAKKTAKKPVKKKKKPADDQ